MEIGIIAVTTGGIQLAIQVQAKLGTGNIYTTKNYEDVTQLEGSLSDNLLHLWAHNDVLIFIMATGIVVRLIAPYIEDKRYDPAVLVMDEKGQFVISLLSGHIGGANHWTHRISELMGALPVITTATDVQGRLAVDMVAIAMNCGITDMRQAKIVSSCIANGKKIGLYTDQIPPSWMWEYYEKIDALNETAFVDKGIEGLIIVSQHKKEEIGNIPSVWLIPKTIIVGIGCRRGKTKDELLALLNLAIANCERKMVAINKIVSVDIKEDEEGIIELARYLKVPFECIKRERIREVEVQFEGSDFVLKTLGVRAVSEPAGYIGSNYGECILPVMKQEGMTLSLWEERRLEE